MGSAKDCIIIAASGSGGHLFPALQIAKAIRKLSPATSVRFVGSGRPLEAQLIDAAGFQRHVISAVGIKGRGPFGVLQFLLLLPGSWVKLWKLFSTYRPRAVVGVGGYVSVAPVLMAALRGIPSWIHEAELKPGMANALLCRVATRISTAFESARFPRSNKVIYTGHPIRDELRDIAEKHQRSIPPKNLLVMGGSQGARALDEVLPELSEIALRHGLKVRHQCRPENVASVASAYARHGLAAEVQPFLDNMAEAYTWADMVIARSGAGTVMEIEAVNVPAIFVPYPFAQGGHQLANAKTLEAKGKAIIVEEGPNLAARLGAALQRILEKNEYAQMLQRSFSRRSIDAAEQIARGVLGL